MPLEGPEPTIWVSEMPTKGVWPQTHFDMCKPIKVHGVTRHKTVIFTYTAAAGDPKILQISIFSRVRDSVKKNNGFWIGWLDLLARLLQSLLITINYNSSHSVTAQDSLHSFLHHECLPYSLSSTVTDLVLIYESVTSSKNDCWLAPRLRLTDLRMNSHLYLEANRRETTISNTSSVIICFIRCYKTCVNLGATLWFLPEYSLLRNAIIASRYLAIDYSVTICLLKHKEQ
jgi:hypothetical protein